MIKNKSRINKIKPIVILYAAFLHSSANADSFFPSWGEWKASAAFAAKDPATWGPVAGAVIVKATNSDEHISSWASENKPLFGDTNVSDDLKDGLMVLALGSVLFSPQQNSQEDSWAVEKGTRVAEMLLSTGLADGTTGMLKNKVQRTRPYDPQGLHSYSFPSGHATEAFAWAAVTRRNLEDYNLSETSRTIWNVGIYTAASSVAWDRVELNAHYPTDVLMGAAVGNFVATTIYRAFTGPSKSNMSLSVDPTENGAVLNVSWVF